MQQGLPTRRRQERHAKLEHHAAIGIRDGVINAERGGLWHEHAQKRHGDAAQQHQTQILATAPQPESEQVSTAQHTLGEGTGQRVGLGGKRCGEMGVYRCTGAAQRVQERIVRGRDRQQCHRTTVLAGIGNERSTVALPPVVSQRHTPEAEM
jgi:hypothetical protein